MREGSQVRLVVLTAVGKGVPHFEEHVGQEGVVEEVRLLVRFPDGKAFWCCSNEIEEVQA